MPLTALRELTLPTQKALTSRDQKTFLARSNYSIEVGARMHLLTFTMRHTMHSQRQLLNGWVSEYGSAVQSLSCFLSVFVTCPALVPPSNANLPSGKAWLGHPPDRPYVCCSPLVGVPSPPSSCP